MKYKTSNYIAIGGTIGVGKTSLIEQLINKYPELNLVPEIDENDILMNILLDKQYKSSSDMYPALCQTYFILHTQENIEKYYSENKFNIFDKTILETRIFGKLNIKKDYVFKFYDSILENVSHRIFSKIGVPQLYIILNCSWETTKKRIIGRSREFEINNFTNKEKYFKALYEMYNSELIKMCKQYNINYMIVNSENSTNDIINELLKKINLEDIIYERDNSKNI